MFQTYENWKRIVRDKIQDFEIHPWLQFCNNHPDMHIAQTCFENISPPDLADEYADCMNISPPD